MFIIRIPLLNLYTLAPETRELANTFILIESTLLVTMSYQMFTNIGIISGSGDLQ